MKTLLTTLLLMLFCAASFPTDPTDIKSGSDGVPVIIKNKLSDKEYLDRLMAAGVTIEVEEIVNYQDTTVRFLLKPSPLDTGRFSFPIHNVMTKRFKFVTSQEDIDSLKAEPAFNTLMMKSRAGHNFWFNN